MYGNVSAFEPKHQRPWLETEANWYAFREVMLGCESFGAACLREDPNANAFEVRTSPGVDEFSIA